MLQVGDAAPEFELPGSDGGEVTQYALRDYLDRGPVLLSFYPLDFAPTCTTEVCGLRDTEWFELVEDLSVLAVSTDGPFSHREFASKYDLGFPLLSDSGGEVAESYGVLVDEFDGIGRIAMRSTFLVDDSGTIRFVDVTEDPMTEPDLDPVREAVAEWT